MLNTAVNLNYYEWNIFNVYFFFCEYCFCVLVFNMFKKWLCKLLNDGAGSKSDNGIEDDLDCDQYHVDLNFKDAALR